MLKSLINENTYDPQKSGISILGYFHWSKMDDTACTGTVFVAVQVKIILEISDLILGTKMANFRSKMPF